MTNSLVKLIDNSLKPAILLIFGKFIGVIFISSLFSTELGIANVGNSLLSFSPVVLQEDLITVSSYSDLFMYAFVSIGFTIETIRAVYFHDSHVNVVAVTKLAKMNLLSMIKSSYEVYHSGVTWFIFTWIANLVTILNVLLGRTYIWIGVVTTIYSMILSVALYRDIIEEISLTQNKSITKNI